MNNVYTIAISFMVLKLIGQADLSSGKFQLTERQIINLRVFESMVTASISRGI